MRRDLFTEDHEAFRELARDFVEKDPRWSQGRLRWDHVVVLPNTDLADDFALPECPRWKIIDRTDLPTMVSKLREIVLALAHSK